VIGKRLGEKVNVSLRYFILYITVLVGISLSVFSVWAVDEHATIGEYINPLNSDDCLEINKDGTCYIETLGLNQGTTGQWKLENERISLLFPYGETYRGMVKTDAILLDESGMTSVVWIKPTKSPPRLRDVAGRYVKEGHPDEYLVLDRHGTYTQAERGMLNELYTISGEWDLDGHVVTLFYLGDRASGISVAVLGGCLYSTGLFGTDIWIGELCEEPAVEEASSAEDSPKSFASIDTSGTHDDATITQLEGLIDDLIEDYRNRLDEIKGYTLSNAESFAYFDNCVSKDKIDIKVDLGATLFSLALSGMTSTAEVIYYKHTAVLSVIEEITWEAKYPVAYALLESVGGIDNIVKASAELTKESLQIVAGEALEEISYQLTSNKSAFSRKLIDHLGQQIDKDQEQLKSLAEEVKLGLWSLTPEEAEQYVVALQALKRGNLFLFDNYSRKSILTKTIAEIRKIDEEDWKLKLADLLWGTSVGLLKVSARLATGGFLLPATITAIDAAREQFFENSQKLSVDAQMAGLAVETLSEGFTIGGTIYNNTQQALKDIRDRNHLCIPQGSISVENKRIRRIFESGIANTTPMYLGEEEVSDVYVMKDEQCGEETKYSVSVFYKAPYTSFRLFPGVDVTYEDLLPVQKTSEVHDGSVRFQYDVSPDGSDLTFYLFGESEGKLYGLQDLSIREWDPIEVVVKESRDYLGRFVSSAIEEQNYEALSIYYDNDTDELIYRLTEVARIKSPGELRMYDSQGRVTGVVNGRVREEIPGAVYDDVNKLVIAPSVTGSCRYEIAGTKRGTYELQVISIDNGEATTFSAVNMPTAARTVHRYTINWDALAKGEQGASLEVDSEGDGSFETAFSSQDKFDGNWVSPEKLANPKGGSLLWLWIILGVAAAIVVTIAIVTSMKRKNSWITLSS